MAEVRIQDLQEGDYVIDWQCAVDKIYRDDDGVWVDTTDGEMGYIDKPLRKVEVMDY